MNCEVGLTTTEAECQDDFRNFPWLPTVDQVDLVMWSASAKNLDVTSMPASVVLACHDEQSGLYKSACLRCRTWMAWEKSADHAQSCTDVWWDEQLAAKFAELQRRIASVGRCNKHGKRKRDGVAEAHSYDGSAGNPQLTAAANEWGPISKQRRCAAAVDADQFQSQVDMRSERMQDVALQPFTEYSTDRSSLGCNA